MASKAKQNAPQTTTTVHQTIVLPQFPRSDDAKVPRNKWVQDYERVQAELLRNHLTDATSPGGTPPATLTVSLRQLPPDWEEQMRQQQAVKLQQEMARRRAAEKKRKERSVSKAIAGSGNANNSSTAASNANTSASLSAAAGPSYYKSGPKDANESGVSGGSKGAAFARARAATADLYSPNQTTSSPTKRSATSMMGGASSGSPTATQRPPPPQRSQRLTHGSVSPIRPGTASANTTIGYSRVTLSPMRARGGEGGASSMLSVGCANESVVTTFAASRLPNTQECARIINHLVVPQHSTLKSSVRPDLSHMDLRWVRRCQPGELTACDLNLDSIRDDLFTAAPSDAAAAATYAINSPRSVIVLLRNGCTVADLQARPASYFRSGKNKANTAHHSSSLALGPSSESAAMGEETAAMAQRHYDDRRLTLAAALKTEYRNLCREVPLADLIEACYSLRGRGGGGIGGGEGADDEAAAAVEDVTFLRERRERLVYRRALEIEQLEKQQQLAADLRRKAAENEEKRFLADLDHKKRLEQRREEAFARQREAEKRQEELRQATEKINEGYQDRLAERRHRLDEKEQRMKENRIQHREEIRRAAQSKAAKREARMERQRELQEELTAQLAARRAEQDFLESERRAKKEKELHAHREQIAASQKLANERREESRRAAEEHEAEVRARAVEKSEAAAQKMAEFQQKLRQRRSEAAQEEAKKNEQRLRIFETAAERQEERREAFVSKRIALEQTLSDADALRKAAAAKAQEVEREAEDDKRMYVRRRSLAVQFDQLMSVANIERKRAKGEAVSRQRERLIDMTLKEREKIRLQRERYDEELYAKAVANQLH